MRLLLAITLVAACGPEDRQGQPDAPVSQPDASPDGDLLPDVPIDETSRVFAHTGSILFQVDDTDFTADEVGTITGLPVGGGGQTVQLLDLALDGNDRMLGVTAEEIYEIDSATGAATLVRALPMEARGATSLSFIPQGGGAADILVTANGAGNVYRIDATGNATLLGNYGTISGKQIRSSGDLFGVRDFGIFATVDVQDDPTGLDYLARIDPTTWQATLIGEGTGFDKIFGLGFWAGKIYGFVDDGPEAGSGKLVEIDPVTGDAISRKTGNLRWFGAAVATDAPVIGRTAN